MALSSAAKENIALKKLVGRAHTHNSVEAFAEPKTKAQDKPAAPAPMISTSKLIFFFYLRLQSSLRF